MQKRCRILTSRRTCHGSPVCNIHLFCMEQMSTAILAYSSSRQEYLTCRVTNYDLACSWSFVTWDSDFPKSLIGSEPLWFEGSVQASAWTLKAANTSCFCPSRVFCFLIEDTPSYTKRGITLVSSTLSQHESQWSKAACSAMSEYRPHMLMQGGVDLRLLAEA